MMITLFQQRSKPFYKFGATMELGTIPAKGWIPYLRRQFAAEGRELPEPLAEKIFTKVELHSSYVQQLAFNVLVCTPTSGTATDDGLAQAYENLLDENTTLFQEKTENLTSYQLNFLKAVISGIHDDFGKADVRDMLIYFLRGRRTGLTNLTARLIHNDTGFRRDNISLQNQSVFVLKLIPVISENIQYKFGDSSIIELKHIFFHHQIADFCLFMRVSAIICISL